MDARHSAVATLQFVRKVSTDVLNGWPEDKLAFQTTPHDNHPLWVLGHLALTDAWVGGAIGIANVAVPASYNDLFGGKSKPSPNARDYPSYKELRGALESTRAGFLAWLEKAGPAELAINISEATHGFMNDPLDAAFKTCWHEGWHFGQVSTLRRALGLPSIF